MLNKFEVAVIEARTLSRINSVLEKEQKIVEDDLAYYTSALARERSEWALDGFNECKLQLDVFKRVFTSLYNELP